MRATVDNHGRTGQAWKVIRRAYKTELDPRGAQIVQLRKSAGSSRFAYNWGLECLQTWYDLQQLAIPKTPRPTAMDLHRLLNTLKPRRYPWLYEVSKCSPQEALRDLERAYQNFFGGRAKHPRFKSRRDGIGSFRLTGSIVVEHDRIQLPRLGRIRLKERGYLPVRRSDVHTLSATVSERAGRWFVSLQVEQMMPVPTAIDGPACGVDLGTANLATLDDGTIFPNPGSLERGLRKLARLQRQLNRKIRGSKNYTRNLASISRLHLRIANIRRDAIHKATTRLARAKSAVGVEALGVKRMLEGGTRGQSRRLADASLGEFCRQMEYKVGWYGSSMEAQPSPYTTMKCSACGAVGPRLPLGMRTFRCSSCGFELGILPNGAHGRDVNAARNLKPRRELGGGQGDERGSHVTGADAFLSREISGDEVGTRSGQVGQDIPFAHG